MADDVFYNVSFDGMGYYAKQNNDIVGEITFVYIGVDKLIIDYTNVISIYRKNEIILELVRLVAEHARRNSRKILTLCPIARSVFNRYPEFDDVRLINAH